MADETQDIFDQAAPSTSGGDVFDQAAGPQAPKNPYADSFLTDMSKVAGATPGTQSPMQAGASRPYQPVESLDIFDSLTGNTDAPDSSATQEFQQRQNQEAAAKITGGDPALAHQQAEIAGSFDQLDAHPVESAVRSVPVAGDVGAGAYHVARGATNLAEQQAELLGNPQGPIAKKTASDAIKPVNEAVRGAMDVSMPAFGIAGMVAPIQTATMYFAAIKSGEYAQSAAKKLGMTPEFQELANTVGTFVPLIFHTATQLNAGVGEQTAKVRDADGNVKDVPVKTAAVGGRGFGFGVGRGEDGSIYAAGRVGKFSARAKWGGADGATTPTTEDRQPAGPVRGLLPQQGVDPTANLGTPHMPDPVQMMAEEKIDAAHQAAIEQADIEKKAADVAAGVKPPTVPLPKGMDEGVLTPQTSGMIAKVIQMLPEQFRPQGILESVGNVAKWIFDKKTVIGPDGKITSVDTAQGAQKAAVKIVNDEIERHTGAQEEQQQQAEEASQQAQDDEETSRTEREEALQPTTEPKKGEVLPAETEIPVTPHTQLAKRILSSLPDNTPAAKMDQALRDKILLPTPIRKALVAEEVKRRASEIEARANEALTGKPTPEGQKPHEIDKWVKAVKDGEEPFAHVARDTTHRPADVEGLSRTVVKGAKEADGIYYHDPKVSPAEIRNAARKGDLDQLRDAWKKGKETAPTTTEAGGEPESEASTEAVPAAAQHELSPYEGSEGKRTNILLADGSSIPAQHKMVELSSLNPSHNGTDFSVSPAYPPNVQERSYHSSKNEQMKVIDHEQNFNPDFLVNTNPDATNGPPIVTSKPVTIDGVTYPAGTVLGGNSRAMTLQRVYTNGAEAPYREALLDNHRSFGFPPEAQEQYNQPVHVREVEPPKTLEEMHRLVSLLNKPPTHSLNVFDQAVSVAKHLSPDTLNGIAELIRHASDADSTATLNAVLSDKTLGKQVVKMLRSDGIITDANEGTFVDPESALLTVAARTTLGNALLANILDTEDLMKATPAILKQKLLGSIGSLSAITATDDGWNLKPALKEAANQYGKLSRMPHASIKDAMAQEGIFSERGPVIDALIRSYDRNVGEVRKVFGLYTTGAMEGRSPSGMLVGLTETPDPYLDFNFAFGTELTKDQFDQEMAKLRGGEEEPTEGITQTAPTAELPANYTENTAAPVRQGEALPPEKPAEKPFTKGDKVTYTTNAGKQRDGQVAFADDRIVRIKDARTGSIITKKKADVQQVGKPAAAPVVEQKPVEKPAQEEAQRNSLISFLDGKDPRNYNELKRLVAEHDKAEPSQLRMKEAQEAYEAMRASQAAQLVYSPALDPSDVFERLVQMYETQPNLSIRTSTSITNQAYSTPLPLAYLSDKFAGINWDKTVYEPTAGNGNLLIAANPDHTLANELEDTRALNLAHQEFRVSRNDASKWTPDQRFDSVVANPPFGVLPAPVDVDGYTINKLEHLIAVKALSVLKDDGKASIIIGASKVPGEVGSKDKPFFNYLYSHYNVVADFELNGDLYSRQGASWPVRVLAVDGRAQSSNVCPPADRIERLNTWESVYDHAVEHLGTDLEGQRRADAEPAGQVRGEGTGRGDVQVSPSAGDSIVREAESETSPEGYSGNIGSGQPGPIVHTGTVPVAGVGSPDHVVASDGDVDASDRLAEDQPRPKAVRREPSKSSGHLADAPVSGDEGGNAFQSVYTPFSEKKDLDVLAPKAMVGAMQKAMESLSEQVGDLDQFVADELGYSSIDDLHEAFMGLQTDTIAAAIHGIMTRGTGIIIADQTGIGKGRQAAAIIRWAELHGHLPIFVTAKPQLFTDMYGDLNDIGSGSSIRPLLMNSDATITHPVTGEKIFGNNAKDHTKNLQRILETGNMPEMRNALFTTYSQVNTPNRQQMVLQRLAPKAVFILDEAHKAGGESNTGVFMRGLLDGSRGAVFLSATYAKRPDNLPLYAGKTDIGMAIPDKERIVSAIEAGGAPLQAVVSYQLAQAGQLFRRERSFDGIEFRTDILHQHQAEHERISDDVTDILRSIVEADAAYHENDFADIQEEVAGLGGTAMEGGNKASETVNHMEFTSIVHNLVKQLLLGLKADDLANAVIEDIKNDVKPIVALENTMGSFLNYYAESNQLSNGAPLHGFTYSTVLQRALDRTRYYNHTDQYGRKTRVEVPLATLSEGTRALYELAQQKMDALKVNIPVSPIDWIRHRVEAAGFKMAEITGRDLRVDYSRDIPILSTVPTIERKDRVATGLGFNNGGIDALILNQAGSTGISLHASTKFKDQRIRKMYIAQAAADINEWMQILGRINRTGQVRKPVYRNIACALPAEIRPAMNASKKLKSLNANVSSNTRSNVSVESPDFMNKYGDKVVQQYLQENPELAAQLGMSVSDGGDDNDDAGEDIARKATGRSALLPVAEQREFLDAVSEQYRDLIEYLDATGQNDLEPKTYDFGARELYKERIYQGTDPSSPFGQDAHFGEYSIKRQGKPFTPQEVQEMIREGLSSHGVAGYANAAPSAENVHRAMTAEMDKAFDQFITRNLDRRAVTDRAREVRGATSGFLMTHRIGSGSRVEINGESYNAVVTNIEPAKKPKGNPYAASSIKFTLALNGPIRGIKISGSEFQKILVMPISARADVPNLFHDINPDSRMRAKIVTGNLLGAYGSFKGNVKGKIVSYTNEDGSKDMGILMPAKFDPKEHVTSDYCMRSAEGTLKVVENHSGTGAPVAAPNGDVQIVRDGGGIAIKTKLSKAVGGKFYKDKGILAHLVGGEFFSRNGMMVGEVLPGHELDAIRAVMGKAALYSSSAMIDRAREYDEAAKQTAVPTKPKFGLGKMLADEEGSSTGIPDAAAQYIEKAVPATWNEVTKAAKASGKSAKKIGREIMAAFAPTALADADSLDIMGTATGEPALRLFEAGQMMRGINKMFDKMPQEKWVEAHARKQTGRKQFSTDLQNAYDLMDEILRQQRARENEAYNLGRDEDDQRELTDKENYAPNRYSKVPKDELFPNEEERIMRLFSRRPFSGSKAFLKQQTMNLKEAVDKGFVPLGNPVQMVMQRLQEGAKYVASKYAWHNAKDAGLAVFVRNGKKPPSGYVKAQDSSSQVFRRIVEEDGREGSQKTGEWYVQEDFGRLFNNYLSSDYIRGTEIGQAFIGLKQASTAMKMGMSLFHYANIGIETMASAVQEGLVEKIYNQGIRDFNPTKVAAGLEDLGKSISAPYQMAKAGNAMIKYVRNPDEFLASPEGQRFARQYPDFPHLMKLVFGGGLRMDMGEDFRGMEDQKFVQAMKEGRLGSAALKVAPWLGHLIAAPLFKHYIPRVKMAFAVQLLSEKLQQYSQALAAGAMTEETIAREVAATVDNRFGEFNWDSLYLNNTLRTSINLMFRAPGWNLGTWRGLSSAVAETFTSKTFDDRIFDKIGDESDKWEWAREKTRRLPQIGPNAGWMLSKAMLVVLFGTVISRLTTGKYPWELAEQAKNTLPRFVNAALECLHPRLNWQDKNGTPARINFPTDFRVFESAANSPSRYAKGALADWLGNGYDTWVNRDFRDNYVYNPQDSAAKELLQGIAYNMKGDFEPISVDNYQRDSKKPTADRMLSFTGATGREPVLDQSQALRHALQARPHDPHTPEQEEAYELTQEQPPTRQSVLRAAREKNLTYLDKVVLHDLSYQQSKEIYDKYATPEEQRQLKPILDRKRTLEIMRAQRGRSSMFVR